MQPAAAAAAEARTDWPTPLQLSCKSFALLFVRAGAAEESAQFIGPGGESCWRRKTDLWNFPEISWANNETRMLKTYEMRGSFFRLWSEKKMESEMRKGRSEMRNIWLQKDSSRLLFHPVCVATIMLMFFGVMLMEMYTF
jgi:hypothetical protein